jgi:hypothetical protein
MYNEDAALRDFMDNDGYPGDTPAYQGTHRQRPVADPSGLGEGDYPDLSGPPRRKFPIEPIGGDECPACHGIYVDLSAHIKTPHPLAASIFDQPDAATTHAKQTAQALIHEYETFANQPGHWTDAAAGAWIGQACATLAELAK